MSTNNGIIFYRLVSPYPEDCTKQRQLDGTEVDNNFLVLKNADVKDAYWENDTLVLQKNDGNIITVTGITEGVAKDLSFSYDNENGGLSVTMNGFTQVITGFTTPADTVPTIYHDETLSGAATIKNPLKVSSTLRTGQYRPVLKVIDTTKCECLPDPRLAKVGDRYLTIENISDYGYLYDYTGVSRISADLRDCASPWRVPTKEDWDNMLNAVEPRGEDKNHGNLNSNVYLGRFAGKLLKSVNFWKEEPSNLPTGGTCCCGNCSICQFPCAYPTGTTCPTSTTTTNVGYGTVGSESRNPYCDPYCGQVKNTCPPCPPVDQPNKGIDKYGFAAVPAGYGDDGGQMGYFGERGYYWTATNSQMLNAYAKRFEYNKSNVYQEIISTNNLLSLRLVKDYDGTNYNERESILGFNYSTVLMPSGDGMAIWTTQNIAFSNRYYNPTAPNNGIGLTMTKRYFISEWNGCRWVVNELVQGDSVVINKAPNGGVDLEYRLTEDGLVCTNDVIYDQVVIAVNQNIEKVQENLDKEIERAEAAEKELSDKIDAETQRAQTAEQKNASDIITVNNNLVTAINTINKNVSDGFNTINGGIAAEVEAREAGDKALDEAIKAETARAEARESELEKGIQDANDKIKAETDRATLQEMLIEDKLDEHIEKAEAEFNSLKDADAALQDGLDAANEKIQTIDDRVTAIEENDSEDDQKVAELEEKLNAEIARSTEKDNEIEGKLLAKEGHSYDQANGEITLKANNPENDIKVKLSFNFGTF